jgi:beta-lactamase regulating signal transducer with metallopeptidase domain
VDTVLQAVVSNALVASLLAVPAAAVSYRMRRPALAHGLWLLVLIKLVTPPLWNVPVSWPASLSSSPEPAVASAVPISSSPAPEDWPAADDVAIAADPQEEKETTPVAELPTAPVADGKVAPEESLLRVDVPASEPSFLATIDWQSALLPVWLAGSAAWALLMYERLMRFQQLLRCATPAPDWLRAEAERLAAKLGLRACPTVWLVPGRVSPMLWSTGCEARLVLPAQLLKRLDVSGRQALLIHELAHYRRGDHWLRWFEMAVSALFWWHPVVWWARHELQEAEEQCCDAWVVWALPGMARSYATALVETIDFLADASPVLPPVASGIGYIHDLKRRLTMIMRGTPPRALTWTGLAGLFGLGAILLPLVPTFAQDRGSGQPPAEERRRQQAREEERRARDARDTDVRQEEAAKLEAEIRKMREQVENMMQQLQKAQSRLQELRGGPQGPAAGRGVPMGPGAGFPGAPGGLPGVPGASGPGGFGPGAGPPGGFPPGAGAPSAPGAPGVPPLPGGAGGGGGLAGRMGPNENMGSAMGGRGAMMGGAPAGRVASIEQRLEMIERTLAEIRQEIRQGQRPGTGAGASGRGRNAGGDAGAPPAERRRSPDDGAGERRRSPDDGAGERRRSPNDGAGERRRNPDGTTAPSPPTPTATPPRGGDDRRPGADAPVPPGTPASPARSPDGRRAPGEAPPSRGGADRPAEGGR